MLRMLVRAIIIPLVMLVPLVMPTTVAFAACGGGSTAKGEVLSGVGQASGGNCSGAGIDGIIKTMVSILSIIVGIAAVIMVITAGFKYITSGGESGSVSSAKRTLVYALVGLAIAALAQFLVHFVIGAVNKAQ